MPQFYLLLLMTAAACSGSPHPSSRTFPLLPGGETRPNLVRVDINRHSSTLPPMPFQIDCSALPYAKGEQRELCYERGRWGTFEHERGILVACSCGEFGGFVSSYSKDGNLLQTLVAGDNPQTLIADQNTLLVVTGITHLGSSEADVRTFRRTDDRWRPVATTPLAKDIEDIEIEPDGSILLRLMFDAGVFRYRAGEMERLP